MIQTREITVELSRPTKLSVKTTKDIDVNAKVKKKVAKEATPEPTPEEPTKKKVVIQTREIDVVTEQEKREKAKKRMEKARAAKKKKVVKK